MVSEQQVPGLRKRMAPDAGSECLFWTAAVLLLFLFLGTAPLSGGEDRLAEEAREMLLTGDWTCVQLNFEEKPDLLLPCWIIAPFLRLFGNSELAVRLPAAVAALVFLWGVRALGRRLFDPGTALLGCWMTLSSCVFLCRGRMAVPDMAAAAAAILSTVWVLKSGKEGGFVRSLLFFLLCLASLLLGGPASLLLPGAVILPRLFSEEDRRALLTWGTVAALAVALLVCELLFLLPGLVKGLPDLVRFYELIKLFPQQVGCAGVLFPFLLPGEMTFWWKWASSLFLALMPWTPFLIAGWIALIRKWKNLSPELRLVWIGMTVVLLIFGPFVFRSRYAVLPLAPLFLLFGAAGLNGYGDPVWEQRTRNILFYTATGASSLFIGSLLAYPLWEKIGGGSPGPVPVFFPAAAGVLAWYGLFMDHREDSAWSRLFRLPHRLGAAAVAATLLTGAVLSAAYPALEELRGEKAFFLSAAAETEKNDLPPDQFFVYGGEPPAGFLFYNALPRKLASFSSLHDAAARQGKAVVMFRRREKVRSRFEREIRALGMTLPGPLAVEKKRNWSRGAAEDENYFAYTIEFPKKSTLKGAVQ